MFLLQKSTGHMLAIEHTEALFNPYRTVITARSQHGEEEQDKDEYSKSDLEFLSHESLPQCWLDPHYRDTELHMHHTPNRDESIGQWSIP